MTDPHEMRAIACRFDAQVGPVNEDHKMWDSILLVVKAIQLADS
ncbi:hypothetical protein [Mycobacterium sp.]